MRYNRYMRGIPTAACPLCGSVMLNITAQFDPETYEISLYFLDAKCSDCGCLLTAPTPLDKSDHAK